MSRAIVWESPSVPKIGRAQNPFKAQTDDSRRFLYVVILCQGLLTNQNPFTQLLSQEKLQTIPLIHRLRPPPPIPLSQAVDLSSRSRFALYVCSIWRRCRNCFATGNRLTNLPSRTKKKIAAPTKMSENLIHLILRKSSQDLDPDSGKGGSRKFKDFLLKWITFRLMAIICPARRATPENYWKR